VSYAHVDDKPDPVVDKGWVSMLVEIIKNRLAAKLGRPDSVDLWMDYRLTGADRVTPSIMDALQNSGILLLIMSPGYLASPWCQKEAESFRRLVQERVKNASRIFMIERDKVDKTDKTRFPAELEDLLGYRFWVEDAQGKPPRVLGMPQPKKDDDRYWDRIADLSDDLARELGRIQAPAVRGLVRVEPPAVETTVFLAEVTDDLDQQREDLKRYLKQAGLRILPTTWYARDPTAYQQALDNDLDHSKLFVQLLSAVPGKKLADLPQGYVGLQLERARSAGKKILQWRSSELNFHELADDQHRQLLESETVLAVGFEEFKAMVVEGSKDGSSDPAPVPPLNTVVFVNTESTDRVIAASLTTVLEGRGVGYVLPLERGKPADIRRDLKTNLQQCDGLIIIYGNATVAWVHEQIWRCLDVLRRRKRPVRALAIYDGPPEQKEPLGFKLPNMRVINCRNGLDSNAVDSFLAQLREDRRA
jgi:hypothetical protein